MMELVQGRRYRVRFRVAGQRTDREMVASFMDASANQQYLYFSGRPAFGTATINVRDTEIRSITEAGKAEPHAPKVVR